MFKENLSIKKIFDSAFEKYQSGNLKQTEVLLKKVLKLKLIPYKNPAVPKLDILISVPIFKLFTVNP